MAIYFFHRILIGAAILFDLGYSYFAFLHWQHSQQPSQLVIAGIFTVFTIGLVVYLMNFNRKTRSLERSLTAECSQCGCKLHTALLEHRQECPRCGCRIDPSLLTQAV